MADKQVTVKFKADSKNAEQGINKVTAKVNSFKKSLDKVGNSGPVKGLSNLTHAVSGVGAAFSAVTKAVGAAVDALNECGEAWKVQLNAERSLEAAAAHNPYLNGQSVNALKDFAGQLQSVSNYGDEQLIPMMGQLAAAGRTQAEIMDIMSAAVDVAASGTMSLESAVKGLNQTYSGSAGSMSKALPALKNLTEEQLRSGEAVRMVAQAYKGQAEATADAAVQMSNAWGDVKEAVGARWNDLLAPAQKALAGFFGTMANGLRESYDRAKALKDAMKSLKDIEANGVSSAGADDYERLKAQRASLREGLKVAEENLAKANVGTSAYKIAGNEVERLKKALADLEPLYRVAQQNHTQAALSAKAEADAAKMAADRERERLDAQKAAADLEAKQSETRARLRESYEESVAQVKKEIEARRQLGEEVSQEEEDRAEYEARYKGYLSLIKEANGLISGNYGTEVAYREKIAELAKKIAEYDKAGGKAGADVKKRLEEFEKSVKDIQKEFGGESPAKKESERISELKGKLAEMYSEMAALEDVPSGKLEEAAAAYADAAARLDEAYARAVAAENDAAIAAVRGAKDKVRSAGGFSEKEEKSIRPNMDAVERRQEALKAEMAAQMQSVQWEQYTADQKKEIWDEYYDDLARLSEEYEAARNQDDIDNYNALAETVANATSKISSALQSAGDSAIAKAEEQKDAELAILEEKYKAGELSEQEYQRKKVEAEREAAKKEYQIKNWQWAAQVAEATANIAVGVSKAIAQNGWPAGAVMAAMAAAAGAIQLATVVSNKPQPPAFERGGIVPGSSYSGDKVHIRANSGEGVFTRGQMKALGLMARGEDRREGGTQLTVENNAANLVGVSPRVDGNRIKLMIDARVNESMKKGRYNSSLAQANEGMAGKFYGV